MMMAALCTSWQSSVCLFSCYISYVYYSQYTTVKHYFWLHLNFATLHFNLAELL